jgi:hypothetical protein
MPARWSCSLVSLWPPIPCSFIETWFLVTFSVLFVYSRISSVFCHFYLCFVLRSNCVAFYLLKLIFFPFALKIYFIRTQEYLPPQIPPLLKSTFGSCHIVYCTDKDIWFFMRVHIHHICWVAFSVRNRIPHSYWHAVTRSLLGLRKV